MTEAGIILAKVACFLKLPLVLLAPEPAVSVL